MAKKSTKKPAAGAKKKTARAPQKKTMPLVAKSKKPAASSGTSVSAVLAQAHALDAAAVRVPSIPVDRLLGEARALHRAAHESAAALAKVGLDRALIDALVPRADALTQAQAIMVVARGKSRTKDELALEKEGTTLRSDMVADGRYALRSDDDAQSMLNYIQEGDGVDDLVQDLKDLSAFFSKYESALARVAADHAAKKARAAEVARSLEMLVATRRAGDAQGGAEKDLRDRCATLLEQAMSEVRASGTYAFRKQPDKQGKFRSTYYAATRARRKKPTAPVASPAQPTQSDNSGGNAPVGSP